MFFSGLVEQEADFEDPFKTIPSFWNVLSIPALVAQSIFLWVFTFTFSYFEDVGIMGIGRYCGSYYFL